ncbi:MAG: hypothetical protein DWH82_04275 [Planctomycetota bacterium]|nr:MAG: hypothetical protein DWH82_04275 [Planctomycetota bacterium]
MPQNLTVQEFEKKRQAGEPMFLLDVRTPEEHAIAALPHSLLVPLSDLTSHIDSIQPPADADLVIYCHHGVRSWHAALYLEQAGFERVHSLGGGIDAYSQAINPAIPRY